jgi:hypothetical protein
MPGLVKKSNRLTPAQHIQEKGLRRKAPIAIAIFLRPAKQASTTRRDSRAKFEKRSIFPGTCFTLPGRSREAERN